MPDLYFNRVPSLPATDDGSGKPLTEDLRTGSDDGEDIAWDGRVGPVVPAGQGEEKVRADPAGGPRRQRRARRRPGGPGTGRRRGYGGAPGTARGVSGEHAI